MKVINRSAIGCVFIPLCEFKFFRRICADLPEDGGSIGEGWPAVNDKRAVTNEPNRIEQFKESLLLVVILG